MIIKTLQALLILAFMTIGFVFVGAFVEYKTLNGANIYAGLTFATILCIRVQCNNFKILEIVLKYSII